MLRRIRLTAGGRVGRSDAGVSQAMPRHGRPARAEGRAGFMAMVGSVSVCRVMAVPPSPQGVYEECHAQRVYEVCHAFAASLPRLLAVGAAAKACDPREASCFRGAGKGCRLRTGPRKHGTPDARTAGGCGNGRIRPCRTAPDDADESMTDRPLSRAVAALRSYGLNRRPIRSADGAGAAEDDEVQGLCKWHFCGEYRGANMDSLSRRASTGPGTRRRPVWAKWPKRRLRTFSNSCSIWPPARKSSAGIASPASRRRPIWKRCKSLCARRF